MMKTTYTIWFRLSGDNRITEAGYGHSIKVEITADSSDTMIKAAQVIYDALKASGHELMVQRP